MVKFLMLLPTTYNDGRAIESDKLETALARIDNAIGGHTLDGVCQGAYRMADGTMAHDTCHKIWAVCEENKLPELRHVAQLCAADMGQESIYLEATPTTVEFIRAA